MWLLGARAPAGALVPLIFLASVVPSRTHVQDSNPATANVARGKPLAEWIVQTSHYIPELRREALKAIAALGPGAREAIPALIRSTRDENEEVRYWSVEALRRIGPSALRLMGPEGKKAVKDLVRVLETTDELEGGRHLVMATADALGSMGKEARPALSVLERQRERSVTPDVVAALDRALRKIRTGP